MRRATLRKCTGAVADGQGVEVVQKADKGGEGQGQGGEIVAGGIKQQQGDEGGGEEQPAAADGGYFVGTPGVGGVEEGFLPCVA